MVLNGVEEDLERVRGVIFNINDLIWRRDWTGLVPTLQHREVARSKAQRADNVERVCVCVLLCASCVTFVPLDMVWP